MAALLACALGGPVPPSRAAGAPAGAIRGVVYDLDFQVPIAGVRVTVIEAGKSALTGEDGNFLIQDLAAGSYTVAMIKEGYERRVLPGVVVAAGGLADLRAEMSIEVIEMEEIIVTGVDPLAGDEIGGLDIRAESANVMDAVSSELIGKAGVGDVAGALKMVVGASVADGKYATVRGLSDRYTGTTLNGLRLPSADPRRRAVQIDMFPTGTIESITVTKTFTPDLQGEFTGGGVDIRTRTIPDAFEFSFSASGEHNTLATGDSGFLTYAGGGVERFGFDRAERKLPGEASDPLPRLPAFSARPTQAQLDASKQYDALVRSFAPVMGVSRDTVGYNHGYSIQAGDRIELSEGTTLGVMGGMTYARKYDFYEDAINNNAGVSVADQPITVFRARADSRGTDELLIGTTGNVSLRVGDHHDFSLRLIANQSAEDEARLQVQDLGGSRVEQNQSLHYTERMLRSTQLRGSHRIDLPDRAGLAGLTGMKLDWVGAVSRTRQDEPDVRFFRNILDASDPGMLSGEMPANSTPAQNTRRIFREVEETNVQGGFDVTLPFTQWSQSSGSIKLGPFVERSDREYEQRSFTYEFPGQFGPFTNAQKLENQMKGRFATDDPDRLWTDLFLNPGRVGLATNNPPAPNQLLWVITPLGDDVDYSAQQTIDAFYAMGELPMTPRLRLIAGARYERTSIAVEPFNEALGTVEIIQELSGGDRAIVTVPQEKAAVDIEKGALLPSVNLVYEVIPGMNLRASWTRTLARPTFRELAPVATEEFLFGDEVIGNAELILSSISNYDLRWEWFPRPGFVLAGSLFYKKILDPIELVSFSTGSRSFIQPVNYESGAVRGAEIEARAPLEFLGRAFGGFTAGVNLSLIDSEVEVPQDEQDSLASYALDEKTRRLQGQPEYLLNANVTWDRDRSGTSVGLFYNLTGETLLTGAARGETDGNPNVFELPYASLDFTASQRIRGNLSISFKAKNILADRKESVYRTPEGEEAIKTQRRTPRLYALSASFKW